MPRRIKRIPKKSITFFGVAGLLLITSFVKLPCPACGGTGMISTSVNMDQVSYTNLQADLKLLNADFCVGYTLYEYDVNITLTNAASEDASGWISLLLKAADTGKVLDTQYMQVQVPKQSTVVDNFTVYFRTGYDQTQNVYIEPDVNAGAVTCLACNGTGRLPLNLYVLAAGTKAKLAKITQVTHPFQAPPVEMFPQGE